MQFYKYQGAGNDFILIDNRQKVFDITNTKKVKALCDRHFGIGADGLILLENSEKADCFMNYYNADGTIAEMCGNGVRCTAKFFLTLTNSQKKSLSIDTRAGVKTLETTDDGSFSVNMGAPLFTYSDFPKNNLNIGNIEFKFVSMGNPHAVGEVTDLSKIDISEIGPKIENNSNFPNKINVELVEKINEDHFRVKVWERGSGATMACGSGACAIYGVLKKESVKLKEVTLEFPGGNLYLSENKEGEIILRGPATFVFKGEVI